MSSKTTKRFSLVIKTQLLEKFDRQLELIHENEKSSISRNSAIQAMMELLTDKNTMISEKEIRETAIYDKETLKELVKTKIRKE